MIEFEWIDKNSFLISKRPVSNKQYYEFALATNRILPVECNDESVLAFMDDAHSFCEWAGLRLPTANEWKSSFNEFDLDFNVAEWIDDMLFGRGWIACDEIDKIVRYDIHDFIYRLDFIGFRCVKEKKA